MAKKNKRFSIREFTNVQELSVANASKPAPAFNPDYSYVIKDLRRIGLLAGVFLAVLVGLSFFLR